MEKADKMFAALASRTAGVLMESSESTDPAPVQSRPATITPLAIPSAPLQKRPLRKALPKRTPIREKAVKTPEFYSELMMDAHERSSDGRDIPAMRLMRDNVDEILDEDDQFQSEAYEDIQNFTKSELIGLVRAFLTEYR